MTFAHPKMLWLLLVFPPAMIAFFWWSWRKRQRLLTQFIETRLLPGLLAGVSKRRRKVRWTCLVLSVVCIIVALARPQWGFTLQEVKQRGLDIVVAIDTSKSMLAEDISPNRLARARLAALDLMQQAKSDRLGLVTFAGSAFLQCPLTFDDAAFRQSVESLDVNTIPQGGTALAEAIDTALTAFKEEDNYKVLVLFTDGEDQDSGALEAAQRAAKAGLRIYTIGIGSAEGELLRLRDNKGRTDYVRDEQGNVVKSRLNEALLQDIAHATEGGFYLALRGATAIDTLYAELARLPKSEHQEKTVKQYVERYHWPLALAIALLVFETLFPERKSEARRATAAAVRETSPLVGTAAFLILVALPVQLAASPSSALREYRNGDYEKSLREYKQLLDRKNDDPRLHFNAGAAAYRDQRYEEATNQFGAVLSAPDVNLQQRAYYNLGNTLYRLGDGISDAQKKIEAWEGAVKQYDSAIKLNTNDADAKFNLAFVNRKLEELKQQQQQQSQPNNAEPSEEARKAKAEADEAVRRREYKKALDIMEAHLQRDPTTSYYSDYIQRLKEVNGVKGSPNR